MAAAKVWRGLALLGVATVVVVASSACSDRAAGRGERASESVAGRASAVSIWAAAQASPRDYEALVALLLAARPEELRSVRYAKGHGEGWSVRLGETTISLSSIDFTRPLLEGLEAHLASQPPERQRDAWIALDALYAGIMASVNDRSLSIAERRLSAVVPVSGFRAWILERIDTLGPIAADYRAMDKLSVIETAMRAGKALDEIP